MSTRLGTLLSLDRQLELCGWPKPEPEHRFAKPRRWRFDWAYPEQRIAIEREGGVWIKGRHTRPSGYLRDLEKYNHAAVLGWKLLRFTPAMEQNGQALKLVERALTASGEFRLDMARDRRKMTGSKKTGPAR